MLLKKGKVKIRTIRKKEKYFFDTHFFVGFFRLQGASWAVMRYRIKTLCLTLLSLSPPVAGQERLDFEQAVCLLLGAGSPEELDESVLDHFQDLTAHPVDLNRASRERLQASGLFSPYQVASLLEYRSRSGAVRSRTELGLVDGFGPRTAEALSRFVSFGPGARRGPPHCRHNLMLTASGRLRQEAGADRPEPQRNAGLKYRLETPKGFRVQWTTRNSYSRPHAGPGGLSMEREGTRGRLVLGDYQLRLGQGLLVWSGFSMSGFSAAPSFCRNATGLSGTGSYSATHRGVAGTCNRGAWTMTAGLSLPGLRSRMDGVTAEIRPLGLASLSRLGRNSEAGLHVCAQEGGSGLSTDLRVGLGPVLLFSEAALYRSDEATALACVAGCSYAPAYRTQYVLLLRAYPQTYVNPWAGPVRSASRAADEQGLSLGLKRSWLDATLDLSRHPGKGYSRHRILLRATPSFGHSGQIWRPAFQGALRWRPEDTRGTEGSHRLDLRFDLARDRGNWTGAVRLHLSHARSWGRLLYGECSWNPETGREHGWTLRAHLRAGFHNIPDWDGRIYVYERDFPGSFNVPAYCGRGHSGSLLCSAEWRNGERIRQRHCFRLRLSLVRHPSADRATSAEVRGQYQWVFG